jgi:exodeoxyribonuclease III
MRLVTWNIRHGGGKRVPQILQHINGLAPDVAVVTEFRIGDAGSALQASLRDCGLTHQATATSQHRQNSVLVAARYPFHVQPPAEIPSTYEHRSITAIFENLVVCGLYFPNQKAKEPLFNWLLGRTDLLKAPALLVGDFNTGLHYEDESGATLLCAKHFARLLNQGWVDLWRARNPQAREFSWFSTARNGFRLDHILASPAVAGAARAISYLHEPRLCGASDHSAMVVDLDNPAQPAAAPDEVPKLALLGTASRG